MNSNQPYRRVDDGMGSGMVSGAVVGGAASAGFIYGGNAAGQKLQQANSSLTGRMIDRAPSQEAADRLTAQGLKRERFIQKGMDYSTKARGLSNMKKAGIVAGGSILASLIGGAIDKSNDQRR
ncbi:hypothetical protein MOD24_14995 [Bacillus haynesii]|uniref:hypothetical protein n=1 Tax=Bacillus haynesii TaxID=1925021 RepID=UPI00228091C0|nr:hypothetical protein [Bacillus haynesii]MCY8577155.1 hypothetical protein [Bacillus haynesii]MEC1657147.1 hypothetical protein [Bacillus haynesii]